MAAITTPSPEKCAINISYTSENSDNSQFKEKFDFQLDEFYKEQTGSVKKPWTSARVAEVIREVQMAKEAKDSGFRRTAKQYYWGNKYDVARIGSEDCLILKKRRPEDPTVQVTPTEQYFDLLFNIHNEIGHGGRDKMLHNIKNKFYIQKKPIEIFVSLCPTCELKRNLPKRGTVTIIPTFLQTAIHKHLNEGHVEMIDLRSEPDGAYAWLLLYQDLGTKFIQLRPLQTNQPSEVAMELLQIFLTFGAPKTLQGKNGNFTAQVIAEVTKLWPDSEIVCKATLTSGKCSNRDVKQMLHTWMQENGSTSWFVACHFVQYQKNATLHPSIGKTPYQALFGCDPPALHSSHTSESRLQSVKTEQLELVPHHRPANDDNTRIDNGMETEPMAPNKVYIKEEVEWSQQEWPEPAEAEPPALPCGVESVWSVKVEDHFEVPLTVKVEPEPPREPGPEAQRLHDADYVAH